VRLIACHQEGCLKAVTAHPPIIVDLVAEASTPLSATFSLFEDDSATNLRGQWKPWTAYEQGEVVYITPEGLESGDTSERAPSAFGVWVATRRTQHSEPGTPGSFWTPMKAWDTAGLGSLVTFAGSSNGLLNTLASVGEGVVIVTVDADVAMKATSSLPYRLDLREGEDMLMWIARGQAIFRTFAEEYKPPSGGYRSALYG
jgi:hypothetical protein